MFQNLQHHLVQFSIFSGNKKNMKTIVQHYSGLVGEREQKLSPIDIQSSSLVTHLNVCYQLPTS